MTEAAIPGRPDHALVRPGVVGRLIRLALGLATLSLLWPLLTVWRAELWAGRVPWSAVGFWVLVSLALWGTSYVFNIAFGLSFGQKTRTAAIAGALLAGLIGFVSSGRFPNPAFGAYLWTWFAVLTVLLGPAHLLAALLATPGCEMRSYAHAATLLRGGDVDAVVCPGGIDRFDHVGRSGSEEAA
jgi:hypothetical protein